MDYQLNFLSAPPAHPVHKKKKSIIKIHVDGASRGNPGPSGAGVYITLNEEDLIETGYFLGKRTNNQAEYLALLLALFLAHEKIKKEKIEHAQFVIISDSELLIKQMNREYKVKNPALVQIKTCVDILCTEHSCTFTHVLREQNKIADKLANVGIDKKKNVPPSFIQFLSDHGVSFEQ